MYWLCCAARTAAGRVEGCRQRAVALRRGAALLLADAGHETVVLCDIDLELLQPSDDDSVADTVTSTLSPDAAAAFARGNTVLHDNDDAQGAVAFRGLRDVAASAVGSGVKWMCGSECCRVKGKMDVRL